MTTEKMSVEQALDLMRDVYMTRAQREAFDTIRAEIARLEKGNDFHDILYDAKVTLYLNPENDESSVKLFVGATFGPTDNLEIMLHAVDENENVVKLSIDAAKEASHEP